MGRVDLKSLQTEEATCKGCGMGNSMTSEASKKQAITRVGRCFVLNNDESRALVRHYSSL